MAAMLPAAPASADQFVQRGSPIFDGTRDFSFGERIALSADGSTMLVGSGDASPRDAAWVFVRSGSSWVQQGPALVNPDTQVPYGGVDFGESVALSADGDTALIGAWGHGIPGQPLRGSAWVFTRSGSTWAPQGPKLTPSDAAGSARFGDSVSLSPDGNLALIGGPYDGSDFSNSDPRGAAWVFTRSGSTWTQQGSKIRGEQNSRFGESVALSADETTAVIGGSGDVGGRGSIWVFARTGSGWTQQGPPLRPSDQGQNENQFGSALAVSAEADTVLVGSSTNSGPGSAWVFTRTGSTWSQQGPKLAPSDPNESGGFGQSVALSADGDTALIGAWSSSPFRNGAAWVFRRGGPAWAQSGNVLLPSNRDSYYHFGAATALSPDGRTALIGSPGTTNQVPGAVWEFVATPGSGPPAPVPTPTPPRATIRGDQAFVLGTANDLYLACTKLDLYLIDVLPAGKQVSVTGAADLRLAGQTVDLLLDGRKVGSAKIRPSGRFAAKVPAPPRNRRARARYQARIGRTASQRLRLVRRMVATTLTRSGSALLLKGIVNPPRARRQPAIAVDRFLSCRRRQAIKVPRVRPDRHGRFSVRIPIPAGAKAVLYRARTAVPVRTGRPATKATFTLPRALDIG
jgi:hypothetical protein